MRFKPVGIDRKGKINGFPKVGTELVKTKLFLSRLCTSVLVKSLEASVDIHGCWSIHRCLWTCRGIDGCT